MERKRRQKAPLILPNWLKVEVCTGAGHEVEVRNVEHWPDWISQKSLLSKGTRLDVRHLGRVFEDCRLVAGHVFVRGESVSHTSGDHPPSYSSSYIPEHVASDDAIYVLTADGLPVSLDIELLDGKVVRMEKRSWEVETEIRVVKRPKKATRTA